MNVLSVSVRKDRIVGGLNQDTDQGPNPTDQKLIQVLFLMIEDY